MDPSTSLPPAEGTHSDSNPATGEGNYVGRRIGRYVLLSLLGEGSMGSVWVADDPLLNIKVALKLLKPTALGNHGAERLLREARAVAQVKHPSIVQMLDFGVSQEGEPYLALELLEGETVRTFTGTGELTPELVVGLILPLLDALSMAHEHGIVHRDIKPDNLFVARDARGRVRPKVLDFGIAKSLLPQRECLTKIGTLIGTPAYMAPEQMRGDLDIDPRADLWALTVTMYELIAGFTPFTGSTVQRLMMAVLDQQPRSLLGVPGVDSELAAIIIKGLAKDRDLRFPDARTMGNALALWLAKRGVQEDACGTSLRAAWLMPGSAVDRLTSRPSMSSSPSPEAVSARKSGVPMTGLETATSVEACRPAAHSIMDTAIAEAPTEMGSRASALPGSDPAIVEAATELGVRPSALPGSDPSIAKLTIEIETRTAIPLTQRAAGELAVDGTRTAIIPVVTPAPSGHWVSSDLSGSWVSKDLSGSWISSDLSGSWVPSTQATWNPAAPSPSVVPPAPPKNRRIMPAIMFSAALAALAMVGAWASSSSAAAEKSAAQQVVAMSAASSESKDSGEPPAQAPSVAQTEAPAEAPAAAAESPAPTPAKTPAVTGARSAGSTTPRVDSRSRGRRAWY
jgi:serine/threonine-protein kinase